MALGPEDQRRLDDGARRARVEFESGWNEWTARDVAAWWDKWCTNGGTNHDRLGWILMHVTGARTSVRGRSYLD